MHWIENLFGSAPDNGSGVTELLFAIALVAVVVAVVTIVVGVTRRRAWLSVFERLGRLPRSDRLDG